MSYWKKKLGWMLGFLTGGAGYGAIEILCRGYTHISMVLAGGLSFLLLLRMARSSRSLGLLSVLGGLSVTVIELVIGCVVNLWLGLSVWDYSHEHFHIWGQICPRFTLLWILLCGTVLYLCRLTVKGLRRIKLPEGLPPSESSPTPES